MRVISGLARGRRLKTVPSRKVRPTADRVKEAIFSMIASRVDLEGARVLDLFAGSGALGIEALSRGATHCTFVERDRQAARVLRENLAACGFEERSLVLICSIGAAFAQLTPPAVTFAVVLLDPPYADHVAQRVVDELARLPLIGEASLVVVEHADDESVQGSGSLRLTNTRSYGKTCVSLLMTQRSEDDTAP